MSLDATLIDTLRHSTAWHMYDREYAVAPSHAYLVVSEDEEAREMLVSMMCARAYCPTACMSCVECRKVLDGNKPDLSQPNPKGELLTVEEAEAIVEDAMMGAFEGGKKVYVLRNMHLQRERVQNFLLKTLEEPNDNVMFLLVAERTKGILPTVLSRVKTLTLLPFNEQQLVQILAARGVATPDVFAKAAMGNLTLALALGTDQTYFALVDEVVDMLGALKSSAAIPQYLYNPIFAKETIGKTLDVLEIAIKDILYIKCGNADSVIYRSKLSIYRQIAGAYPIRSLPMILDIINEAKLKIAAYCTAVNVADCMLLSMLEVKAICAQS